MRRVTAIAMLAKETKEISEQDESGKIGSDIPETTWCRKETQSFDERAHFIERLRDNLVAGFENVLPKLTPSIVILE